MGLLNFVKFIMLNHPYDVFEINLDEVISESKVKPKYEEVTKYPEITRDIAMLVDVKDEYQNIFHDRTSYFSSKNNVRDIGDACCRQRG